MIIETQTFTLGLNELKDILLSHINDKEKMDLTKIDSVNIDFNISDGYEVTSVIFTIKNTK